jgi:hypothetical protein
VAPWRAFRTCGPCRGPPRSYLATSVEEIPFPLLVLLIVAAVVAGLVLGAKAGKIAPASSNDGKPRKTLGARVRGAATDGVVKLWKWNRNRKKNDE